MNYQKIYDILLERSNGRTKSHKDGLHKHRILPGHMGGKYTEENIALLTRKEHRLIHLLRYKIFNNPYDYLSRRI